MRDSDAETGVAAAPRLVAAEDDDDDIDLTVAGASGSGSGDIDGGGGPCADAAMAVAATTDSGGDDDVIDLTDIPSGMPAPPPVATVAVHSPTGAPLITRGGEVLGSSADSLVEASDMDVDLTEEPPSALPVSAGSARAPVPAAARLAPSAAAAAQPSSAPPGDDSIDVDLTLDADGAAAASAPAPEPLPAPTPSASAAYATGTVIDLSDDDDDEDEDDEDYETPDEDSDGSGGSGTSDDDSDGDASSTHVGDQDGDDDGGALRRIFSEAAGASPPVIPASARVGSHMTRLAEARCRAALAAFGPWALTALPPLPEPVAPGAPAAGNGIACSYPPSVFQSRSLSDTGVVSWMCVAAEWRQAAYARSRAAAELATSMREGEEVDGCSSLADATIAAVRGAAYLDAFAAAKLGPLPFRNGRESAGKGASSAASVPEHTARSGVEVEGAQDVGSRFDGLAEAAADDADLAEGAAVPLQEGSSGGGACSVPVVPAYLRALSTCDAAAISEAVRLASTTLVPRPPRMRRRGSSRCTGAAASAPPSTDADADFAWGVEASGPDAGEMTDGSLDGSGGAAVPDINGDDGDADSGASAAAAASTVAVPPSAKWLAKRSAVYAAAPVLARANAAARGAVQRAVASGADALLCALVLEVRSMMTGEEGSLVDVEGETPSQSIFDRRVCHCRLAPRLASPHSPVSPCTCCLSRQQTRLQQTLLQMLRLLQLPTLLQSLSDTSAPCGVSLGHLGAAGVAPLPLSSRLPR